MMLGMRAPCSTEDCGEWGSAELQAAPGSIPMIVACLVAAQEAHTRDAQRGGFGMCKSSNGQTEDHMPRRSTFPMDKEVWQADGYHERPLAIQNQGRLESWGLKYPRSWAI